MDAQSRSSIGYPPLLVWFLLRSASWCYFGFPLCGVFIGGVFVGGFVVFNTDALCFSAWDFEARVVITLYDVTLRCDVLSRWEAAFDHGPWGCQQAHQQEGRDHHQRFFHKILHFSTDWISPARDVYSSFSVGLCGTLTAPSLG